MTTPRSRGGAPRTPWGAKQLEGIFREHGLDPAGPALGNFLFAEVGDGREIFEQLLRQGVIVRPCGGFGAPGGDPRLGGHRGRERGLRRSARARPFGRLVLTE